MLTRVPALALHALLLLALLSLGACRLPPNTALGDWSRTARIAIDRPSLATPPHAAAAQAMQAALGRHFLALAVLWDGADLRFAEGEWPPLVARAAAFDPAAGAAVAALGAGLSAASLDQPLAWMPRDNSGPRPLHEDWRLVNLIAANDGAVQALLAGLARAMAEPPDPAPAPPAPPPPAPGAEPALRHLQREAEEARMAARAAEAASRRDYVRLLPEIAAEHAALRASGRLITQRAMERQLFLAEDRLRRVIAALPSEAAPAP